MTSSPFQIRHATPDDVSGLHDLTVAVTREGRGVVFTVEDVIARGPRAAQPIADSLAPATRDDILVLVAAAAGTVVGHASVRRLQPTLARHVGVFSLQVHPAHQRQGIGRALTRGAIEWAKPRGIERLELFTRDDNHRARALYESEGFRVESKRARFLRLTDGTYVDDVVYVRFL